MAALYQETLRLGVDLLALLQAPLNEEGLDQMERLLQQREEMARKTADLFQPGDQNRFQQELHAILKQQRALEAQMQCRQDQIRAVMSEAQKARGQVQGVQRVLRSGPKPRWIDERR